jgi:chaperone required for assembly of F1-ATPase
MSGGWVAKRFWTVAIAEPVEGGFAVRLDARPLRTPGKAALILPTRAMAEAVAAEWRAQAEVVAPSTMPVTRAANSAIDKIAVQFDEVAGLIAAYGGDDLLCYRATWPEELIARQSAGWDGWLDWAAAELDAPLVKVSGVIHADQPPASLDRFRAEVTALDPFRLMAMHDLVSLSGSLVLALAVSKRRIDVEAAWDLSRIDENWQIEQWGVDDEATALTTTRREAFFAAARFWNLC